MKKPLSEYAIGRYNLADGLFEVKHAIIDPGPPEYGLKAEVRQFAVQTHHIDFFNDNHEKELQRNTSPENIDAHWARDF